MTKRHHRMLKAEKQSLELTDLVIQQGRSEIACIEKARELEGKRSRLPEYVR